MFVITDCRGDIVGRREGYKKHATAQALAERAGRIKSAIWGAYHMHYKNADSGAGRRLVYRIEWQNPTE